MSSEVARADLPGRDQLKLTCPELLSQLGRKYCDEVDLVSLLLAHGLIRRVRTIGVEVRPLEGASFKIRLAASGPTVGEAKVEIAYVQGTSESRQALYLIPDGGSVEAADKKLLKDNNTILEEGSKVTMAVVDEPPCLLWQTCNEEFVILSEDGALATNLGGGYDDDEEDGQVIMSGTPLTVGKHYWEVEIVRDPIKNTCIGVTR
jgi:hypothetical protein